MPPPGPVQLAPGRMFPGETIFQGSVDSDAEIFIWNHNNWTRVPRTVQHSDAQGQRSDIRTDHDSPKRFPCTPAANYTQEKPGLGNDQAEEFKRSQCLAVEAPQHLEAPVLYPNHKATFLEIRSSQISSPNSPHRRLHEARQTESLASNSRAIDYQTRISPDSGMLPDAKSGLKATNELARKRQRSQQCDEPTECRGLNTEGFRSAKKPKPTITVLQDLKVLQPAETPGRPDTAEKPEKPHLIPTLQPRKTELLQNLKAPPRGSANFTLPARIYDAQTPFNKARIEQHHQQRRLEEERLYERLSLSKGALSSSELKDLACAQKDVSPSSTTEAQPLEDRALQRYAKCAFITCPEKLQHLLPWRHIQIWDKRQAPPGVKVIGPAEVALEIRKRLKLDTRAMVIVQTPNVGCYEWRILFDCEETAQRTYGKSITIRGATAMLEPFCLHYVAKIGTLIDDRRIDKVVDAVATSSDLPAGHSEFWLGIPGKDGTMFDKVLVVFSNPPLLPQFKSVLSGILGHPTGFEVVFKQIDRESVLCECCDEDGHNARFCPYVKTTYVNGALSIRPWRVPNGTTLVYLPSKSGGGGYLPTLFADKPQPGWDSR